MKDGFINFHPARADQQSIYNALSCSLSLSLFRSISKKLEGASRNEWSPCWFVFHSFMFYYSVLRSLFGGFVRLDSTK